MLARLQTTVRLADNGVFVASCPSLGLASTARGKNAAHEALRDAVELWLRSCCRAGVIDKALRERGFVRDGDWFTNGLERLRWSC